MQEESEESETTFRRRLLVRGIVQGVGFRPFLYQLASRHGLTGFAGNDREGVFLEVQGRQRDVDRFQAELTANPPPLAKIVRVEAETRTPVAQETAFVIRSSEGRAQGAAWISPDVATCDTCLAEMANPANRRYRYPFINCTQCGPRFTITLRTPYDRPETTMARFTMCPACQAEYDSPADRRFHAQPNACPACGPQLSWVAREETVLHREQALLAAQQALRRAGIVAVKGIGGFHLAVDATQQDAVQRLRDRKHRYGKPLAIMVHNLEMARTLADVNQQEAALLVSRERPIVLLQRKAHTPLSESIAPGTRDIGIMLPYSALHVLLTQNLGPIVMTSANLSEQPILWRNEEALRELAQIADGFLLHDRDIHIPCDDSVVRLQSAEELPIRRSRGFAPMPVSLHATVTVRAAKDWPSILAVGAELKSTFCLTREDQAFLSQHLGDMQSRQTLDAFDRAFAHFRDCFHTQPQAVACDMHPAYLSTRWAQDCARGQGLPLVRVQHHHAHLVSALTEHARPAHERAIGLIFDGTGYGADGTIWGGEVLTGNAMGFERHVRLQPMPMPGGDAAVRKPYRLALAALWKVGIPWEEALAVVRETPPEERRLLQQQLIRGVNVPYTSSMGRLFDAVAALIGLRRSVDFEAQAAVELESIAAGATECRPYPMELQKIGRLYEWDIKSLLEAMVEDCVRNTPGALMAQRFHQTVLAFAMEVAQLVAGLTGLRTVALSGGVWQNRLLCTQATERLRAAGFEVLLQHRVPANDGGIALGQAAICLAKLGGTGRT